jgi:hypothetical protein
MTPLRKAAEVSQLVIKWGAVAIVSLMVGRVVVGAAIQWYKQAFPDIPDPTIGFGILPPVAFPDQEPRQLTYKLETVSGRLPDMPTQAEVLYMNATRPNLLALERSQEDADTLGFKVKPDKISDTAYRWVVQAPVPMTLTTSIYDGRFIWKTDWSSNPNFLAVKTLPSQIQAVKEVRDMVGKMEEDPADITEGESTISYLKGLNGVFQPATSLADADFIQVDLFRKRYKDSHPFVTPETGRGVVRAILSGNPRAGRMLQVEYNYFMMDYSKVETYPLRPAAQAWQELQQGSGYIASLDPGVTEVVVRRVELGYFDSFEPQQYMQPVYVFSGDNNFVGYIQAVKDPKVAQ